MKSLISWGQLFVALVAVPSVLPAQSSTAPVGTSNEVTAFVNVNVVPMDTERILEKQTVLVKHGRITAIGPVAQLKVPAEAARIDGLGQYLIPGLADMHAHLGIIGGHNLGMSHIRTAERKLFQLLGDGVTTIRNMDAADSAISDDFKLTASDLLRLRARAAAWEIRSPRIYTSASWAPAQYQGLPSTRHNGYHAQLAPGWKPLPPPRMDSVAVYVQQYKAAGYDYLKIHDESAEIFDSILAAARRIGFPVVGHVPPWTRLEAAFEGGMRSIEHLLVYYDFNSFSPRPDLPALVAATKRADIWNCPTLALMGRRLGPEFQNFVKVLRDAGAGLLLGTDDLSSWGRIAEYYTRITVHDELQALVKGGLTPYQALATGTRNAAMYFGTLAESGTIAVGKRADLVLLRGNPITDIRNTTQPAGVMLGGRWLTRNELDRGLVALTPALTYAEVAYYEVARPVHALRREASSAEQRSLQNLEAVHSKQRKTLADSLGSVEEEAGRRQLLNLVAQQLAAFRLALPATLLTAFDLRAKERMALRAREGYPNKISGVPE